jgi:hypothetical protein
MKPSTLQSPGERAARRAAYFTGLVWHAGTFVIINGFFLLLDFIGDGGINWSLWIIAVWGFALAFHVLAYLVDGTGLRDRKRQQYLDEDQPPR